jgi:hypothetical protein
MEDVVAAVCREGEGRDDLYAEIATCLAPRFDDSDFRDHGWTHSDAVPRPRDPRPAVSGPCRNHVCGIQGIDDREYAPLDGSSSSKSDRNRVRRACTDGVWRAAASGFTDHRFEWQCHDRAVDERERRS